VKLGEISSSTTQAGSEASEIPVPKKTQPVKTKRPSDAMDMDDMDMEWTDYMDAYQTDGENAQKVTASDLAIQPTEEYDGVDYRYNSMGRIKTWTQYQYMKSIGVHPQPYTFQYFYARTSPSQSQKITHLHLRI